MITIPFTYYIYHKPSGKKYYGVRYGRGANPDQLWKSYFTSSSLVRRLINEFGKDSFVVKIRKIFDDKMAAIRWENRVLTRLKAAKNPDWLNRSNGGPKFRGPETQSDNQKLVASKTFKGVPKPQSQKDKMSIAAAAREKMRRDTGWSMPKNATQRGIVTRATRIASGEINPYSAERNAKMGASKRGKRRKYLEDGSFIMV